MTYLVDVCDFGLCSVVHNQDTVGEAEHKCGLTRTHRRDPKLTFTCKLNICLARKIAG